MNGLWRPALVLVATAMTAAALTPAESRSAVEPEVPTVTFHSVSIPDPATSEPTWSPVWTPEPTVAPTPEPTPTPTPPPPSLDDARTYAMTELGPTQYACLASLIQRESGWRVDATNPTSGAYGLPQALPGSKMATAGDDWRTNPVTQIRWMIRYVDARYGSACGAWRYWQKKGWY